MDIEKLCQELEEMTKKPHDCEDIVGTINSSLVCSLPARPTKEQLELERRLNASDMIREPRNWKEKLLFKLWKKTESFFISKDDFPDCE